jgi:hypothetical protein
LDVDVFGGVPSTPDDLWKKKSKNRWIARSNHLTKKRTTASKVASSSLPLAPLGSPTSSPYRLPPKAPSRGSGRSQRTKRVSFPTNHQGEIIPQQFTYECSTADRRVIWWTAAEITAMQDNVLNVCEFFVRFRADYAHTVVDLISACTDVQASRHRLRKSRALLDVANSSVRGLEATIVTILEQRQTRTVAQVLQHQERLQTSNYSSATDESIHLLAVQYRRNSRYAALWAQIVADGDALVVEDENDESVRQ